jgi:hypothetical protein
VVEIVRLELESAGLREPMETLESRRGKSLVILIQGVQRRALRLAILFNDNGYIDLGDGIKVCSNEIKHELQKQELRIRVRRNHWAGRATQHEIGGIRRR